MSHAPGFFDALYQRDADPWQVHTRWYEQRKQAVLLASLPHRRYARAFETACGTGALTAALAGRCDELLASDASEAAVRITRDHLSRQPSAAHVRVVQQALPGEWPQGHFDLIVIGEWAYYIPDDDLAQLARACHDGLTPTGCLVACHWRPDFPERRHTTEALHALLGAHPGWTRLIHHEEEDFLLDIWSPSDVSVARGAESAPGA